MRLIAWNKDLKIDDIKPGDGFVRIKLSNKKTILKLHLVNFTGKHIDGTWLINLSEKKLKLHDQITSDMEFQLAGINHIRAMIEKGSLNQTKEQITTAKNKKKEKMITLKSESDNNYTVKTKITGDTIDIKAV